MMKYLFLIQDETYDFCYETINAISYKNWFNNNDEYQYELMMLPLADKKQLQAIYSKHNNGNFILKNVIPIGTVEFVLSFYKTVWNINNIKPINIPRELWCFCKRDVVIDTPYDLNGKFFIKSIDYIKNSINKFYDMPNDISMSLLSKNKKYFITKWINNIVSEWRIFVYNKEILGLKNYSGDEWVLPNKEYCQKIVDFYDRKIYTLDVMVTEDGNTDILEFHQFFSCGLYGFNHPKLLNMMICTHNEILKGNDK